MHATITPVSPQLGVVAERTPAVSEPKEQPRPDDQPGDTKEELKKPTSARTRALLIGGGVVLLLAGTAYWYHGTFYEDTDDAQIDGYISNVSSRVAGTVNAVYVADDQPVSVGQLLLELDPTDLRVARDLAKATLAQAEAQLRAEQSNASVTETSDKTLVATSSSDVASGQASVAEAEQSVAQANAQIKQAEANDQLTQLERRRDTQLFQSGAIAKAELDAKNAAADASSANVEAVREAVKAADQRVDEQVAKAQAASSRLHEAKSNAPEMLDAKRAMVALRRAAVDAARSALEQAELNLTYATTSAPVKGIVGKRSVDIGDHVSVGQALLALTQTGNLWVTADFRETQVRHIHAGERVTVHVDALGRDFEGEVVSIAAATGSRYSVLPPENATGNYVKVVQRMPVRIRLSPGQAGLELLRPGMSAEPKVRVK